jgi:hypothetical protein
VIIFSCLFEHEWMKWKTETYWKNTAASADASTSNLNITLNKITGI